MKTRFSILFVAVLGFVWTGCQNSDDYASNDTAVEKTEAEKLTEQLETNKAEFHAALEGLTDEQLAYQESEDRWSIMGCAEHIAAAHGAMYGMLEGVMASDPVAARPDSMMTDEQIWGMITDRTTQFDAPAPFQPSGRYESMEALLADFDATQAKLAEVLKSDKDLRSLMGEHPAGITMDAQQWVVFIMGHANRHMQQIQQVKDHAGYPSA